MFDDFKDAWKVKHQKDYQSRRAKVQAALDELWLAGDQLEALHKNGNDSAKVPFKDARFEHKREAKRLEDADDLAKTDKLAAYKLLDEIKKAARTAAEAASKAREEKVYQDPSSRLQLDMGEGWQGPPAKVHPASIKGFDKLNKDEIEQATKEIGAKIKKGKQLLDDLMVHPEEYLDKQPELKEITDLMWYLRNKAEEMVGQAFEKGALSLPDSGNLLRGYLDRCQEVYNRYSSHMKAQQEKVGGSARAIDAYEGDIKTNPDALLPYGMNTMLVQSIKMDKTGEERLYIKLETESARLGAPSLGAMPKAYAQHGLDVDPQFAESRGDLDAATLPKSRPQNPEDMERTIEHGKNLVRKQKSRVKNLKRFAENEIGGDSKAVEKELVPRYEAIIKAVKKLDPALVDALKKGNYKKEVNEMAANLEAFTSLLEKQDLKEDQAKAVDEAMEEFDKYFKEKGLDQNAESRVMTEVVLTADALKPKGLTAESVAGELNDALKDLKERESEQISVANLQALANGARRTLQRAANFTAAKPVKAAVQLLQAELDKVSNEIELLKHLSPQTADKTLQAHRQKLKEITQRSAIADDPAFPKLDEAQEAYDKALQAAYDIMQLSHLAKNDVVQTQVKKLAKEADEFLNVVELIETISKT